MTARREGTVRFSLKRWSQRKLASGAKGPETASADARTRLSAQGPPEPSSETTIRMSRELPAGNAGTAAAVAASAAGAELPPVESLTFDSDFTAFLRPEVDPALQRAALKQLFRDPRFNVMDGLDIYIGDYTKPDPIPPDMLAELVKRFDFAPATADPAVDPGDAGPRSHGDSAAPTVERVGPESAAHETPPASTAAISDATAESPASSATISMGSAGESALVDDPSPGPAVSRPEGSAPHR